MTEMKHLPAQPWVPAACTLPTAAQPLEPLVARARSAAGLVTP